MPCTIIFEIKFVL